MPRSQPLPLDVLQIKPLAEKLAWRIARQPADVDDLVQTGLFAYISDYERLTRRSQTPSGRLPSHSKAWSLARGILRRAMIGYYDTATERTALAAAALDEPGVGARLEWFATQNVGQQTDLLEMNDYLGALERTCGHQARVIVENLIAPMGDCAMRLFVEIRRKRRVQQRGYSHAQPRVRISQRAIREAMALDKQTWAAELRRVRGFTRAWLAKTG